MKLLYHISLLAGCLLLSSCTYIDSLRRKASDKTDAIVSIDDQHLYRSDIERLVPAGTSPEDSAAIVNDYIRVWATDVLMYRNARRNVKNEEEIKRLMDDYERTITIHYYRQNMVQEKVEMPTEAEAAAYYNEHTADFQLKESAIRGMIVSVPVGSSRLNDIRRKMKHPENNIAEIERFAMQNAVVYSLFDDKWQLQSAVEKSVGRSIAAKQPGYVEHADSALVDMIYISDFVPAGESAPLQMVVEEARLRLYQERKMQYLSDMDNEIYEYALNRGEIEFHLPKTEKADTVAASISKDFQTTDSKTDSITDTVMVR